MVRLPCSFGRLCITPLTTLPAASAPRELGAVTKDFMPHRMWAESVGVLSIINPILQMRQLRTRTLSMPQNHLLVFNETVGPALPSEFLTQQIWGGS